MMPLVVSGDFIGFEDAVYREGLRVCLVKAYEVGNIAGWKTGLDIRCGIRLRQCRKPFLIGVGTRANALGNFQIGLLRVNDIEPDYRDRFHRRSRTVIDRLENASDRRVFVVPQIGRKVPRSGLYQTKS